MQGSFLQKPGSLLQTFRSNVGQLYELGPPSKTVEPDSQVTQANWLSLLPSSTPTEVPGVENAVKWCSLYSSVKAENYVLRRDIDSLRVSLADVRSNHRKEIDELKQTIAAQKLNHESKIKDLNGARKEISKEAGRLRLKRKEEVKKLMNQIKDLDKTISILRQSNDDLSVQLATMKQEMDQLQKPPEHETLVEQQPTVKKAQKQTHKCDHCSYTTEKANRMQTHVQEGCKSANPIKDMQCKICEQMFTYNGLRFHLNQYVKKGAKKATNGHQKVSVKKHCQLLKKIKEQKKQQ